MPDLAENVWMWDATYDWSRLGDEWSDCWGGVTYQWWVTIFARLQGYVPAGRILEIAPGYGRWTHFLRELCDELIGVDIAAGAVEHCRARFAGDPRVSFHVNDGTSLAMAEDRSVDLVFSFDSLVHAERDVLAGYLAEFARILADDGVAFIHHSNLGAYQPGTYDPAKIHWRGQTVSAAVIEQVAHEHGLRCVSQEPLMWGNETTLNDCISVITRAGSRWDRENVVVENPEFSREEISVAHRISRLYPQGRSNVAFRAQPAGVHEHALTVAAEGDLAGARELLRADVRRRLDAETLNDLAVLAHMEGDRDEAIAMLEALVRLHPEHEAAQANLADLRAAEVSD